MSAGSIIPRRHNTIDTVGLGDVGQVPRLNRVSIKILNPRRAFYVRLIAFPLQGFGLGKAWRYRKRFCFITYP
jgi:hypothetical protein